MELAEVRRLAMALRGTTESPHHRYTSFRVRGRIYATAPREGGSLHLFLDDADRDRMVTLEPETYSLLRWGKRVAGLRVELPTADPVDVAALLNAAWRRKVDAA
jgi:hypothetical protein